MQVELILIRTLKDRLPSKQGDKMNTNEPIKFNINKFSSRLHELMKENNLTTYTLADIIYLSPSAISRYINAKMKPKRTTIEILAKYFNVNSDWLMGIDDERGIYTLDERLENIQEKHLILLDDQILLLLDCIKIHNMQSKLFTGKENFQLNDIEMIIKDYMENRK